MPIIRGSVPNIGNIAIDAEGFAEESTLRELVRVASGKSAPAQAAARASKDATLAADQASDSLFQFGDTIDLTSDQIQRSNSALYTSAQKSAQIISSGSAQVATTFRNLNDDQGNLTSTIQTLTGGLRGFLDSIDDIVDDIPLIGGAIGVVTGAAKAVAEAGAFALTFVTGTLQGLRDQQQALFDSGVYFSRGIDDAADLAREAGTTIGAMARAAADAKESLRLFEGGAASGARKVTKAFGQIGSSGQELLYSYGYTQEEILAGIADFGASAAMAGRNLSVPELAEASVGYLTNLKELERISGKNAKDAEAQLEANRRNLAFQEYLKRFQDPKVAAGIENFVANLSPEQAEIIKARLMGYTVTDPKLLYMQNNIPGMVDAIDRVKNAADTGALTVDTMDEYFGSMQTSMKAGIDEFVGNISGGNVAFLGQLQQSDTMFGEVLRSLGEQRAEARTAAEAAKATAETLKPEEIAANNAKLNKAIADLTQIEIVLASQTQGAVTKLTEHAITFAQQLEYMVRQTGEYLGTPESRLMTETGPVGQVGREILESEGLLFEGVKNIPLGQPDPLANMSAEELAQSGLKRTKGRFGTNYTLLPQPRALGGPVARGSDYLVGESGPELFRPSTDGQIIPTGSAIPVKLSDASVFSNMTARLDSLIQINSAMLRELGQGNNISRQSAMYAR